jgi:hypothetical protein
MTSPLCVHFMCLALRIYKNIMIDCSRFVSIHNLKLNYIILICLIRKCLRESAAMPLCKHLSLDAVWKDQSKLGLKICFVSERCLILRVPRFP